MFIDCTLISKLEPKTSNETIQIVHLNSGTFHILATLFCRRT